MTPEEYYARKVIAPIYGMEKDIERIYSGELRGKNTFILVAYALYIVAKMRIIWIGSWIRYLIKL